MATKKGVKKKEHEKLDDTTIERVISLLEAEVPITKKVACEILNISYNTTRLTNIITEFKEKKERRKRLFEKTKGTPITDFEISSMLTPYLQGAPLSDISEWTYRSPGTVKRIIEALGVPEKPKGDDYFKAAMLPDECVLKEPPKIGDFLWSAKYHAVCEVTAEFKNSDGSVSYRIYIFEKNDSNRVGGFYAYQPQHELGSLKHLEKYIKIKALAA